MNRGIAGKALSVLVMMLVAGLVHNGAAQEEAAPERLVGEDVTIREIEVELDTMGLIWIQEGNVKRLAYVVQTGDTLWDIAERYLNSPYYWPKIWERNTFIINPHLIFPGDILYVYPEGLAAREYAEVAEEAVEEGPAKEKAEEKEKKEIVYKSTGSLGFVVLEEMEAAGKIVDNKMHKSMLGEGDIVYVDVGKVDRVVKGDRYSIFRVKEMPDSEKYLEIKHPVTGEVIGYQILNLGELKVIEVEVDVSTAKIEDSYAEIHNGDLIKPYFEPLAEKVKVKTTDVESLHGYIIASKRGSKILGENDIVYIDRGVEDGVERGNAFTVYKPCELIKDGLHDEMIRIPEEILGELIVLKTNGHTSVGLITQSYKEMHPGEKIFMSKYDSWEIEGVSQPVEVEECMRDPACKVITEQEYEQGKGNPYCEKMEDKRQRWRLKD